jgi:hypothetical protein
MYQDDDGRWFFDDPAYGIIHEEMVLGADILLTAAAQGERRLTIDVSTAPLNDPLAQLQFIRPGGEAEGGLGSWYRDVLTGQDVWLCPTLLVYFDPAPAHLWVRQTPAY